MHIWPIHIRSTQRILTWPTYMTTHPALCKSQLRSSQVSSLMCPGCSGDDFADDELLGWAHDNSLCSTSTTRGILCGTGDDGCVLDCGGEQYGGEQARPSATENGCVTLWKKVIPVARATVFSSMLQWNNHCHWKFESRKAFSLG